MLDDGTRFVPSTKPAARTLVLLGDSVTFGWGVNDADTWASKLAEDLPDWHIINTGIPGYNSENVLLTLRRYETADAFIYLIISNDADPTAHPDFRATGKSLSSWSSMYLGYLTHTIQGNDEQIELGRFRSDLEIIQQDQRVLLVGFPGPLTDVAKQVAPRLHEISSYTGHNSYIDAHANTYGNEEIKNSLQPLIDDFLVTS